jgi:ferredoxin
VPAIRFVTSDRVVEFDDGTEVNLLRTAIRNECGVPYKCASGNCGTDRVHVESGAENLSPVRRKERDRLGSLVDEGWRLACQTYTAGDVSLTWDPDQKALPPGRAAARLREKWLTGEAETAGEQEEIADVG